MKIAGHQVDDAMFDYIAHNFDADTCKLLLKEESNLSFDKSFAILQIECRRKCRDKIPELLKDPVFLFPKSISAEQCTHQAIAQFHASHIGPNENVLDMTMGLGIDDYYISMRARHVTAIELDSEIAAVGHYNLSRLRPNITVTEGDSVDYIKKLDINEHFDVVFIDPARRDCNGKRLYGLADCKPNVLELLPYIKQHTSRLYIKASPMIDVSQSIRELGSSLSQVWAVSVRNECKELFFMLNFDSKPSQISLHAINYDRQWQEFSCHHSPTTQSVTTNTIVPVAGMHLYEPNASLMKLGCFDALATALDVAPIAVNSHLYISTSLLPSFPGRKFVIVEVMSFNNKCIKQLSSTHSQLNVSTRNFRLNAEQLKKRLKVKDGGNDYLFATTLSSGEQVLLLCKKA